MLNRRGTSILTSEIIRKELWRIIANLEAADFREIEKHYDFLMPRLAMDGHFRIIVSFRGIREIQDFPEEDLTLSLDSFGEKYLMPLGKKLVPRYEALLKQLDSMWENFLRPKMIEFVNNYREDSDAR